MDKVIKVVRRRCNGHRVSALVKDRRLRTRYPLNREVYCPDGMKLLAFSNLEDAGTFARINALSCCDPEHLELWEAEATGVTAQRTLEGSLRCTTFEDARRFWAHDMKVRMLAAPSGTVSCSSIKLVRKVG